MGVMISVRPEVGSTPHSRWWKSINLMPVTLENVDIKTNHWSKPADLFLLAKNFTREDHLDFTLTQRIPFHIRRKTFDWGVQDIQVFFSTMHRDLLHNSTSHGKKLRSLLHIMENRNLSDSPSIWDAVYIEQLTAATIAVTSKSMMSLLDLSIKYCLTPGSGEFQYERQCAEHLRGYTLKIWSCLRFASILLFTDVNDVNFRSETLEILLSKL